MVARSAAGIGGGDHGASEVGQVAADGASSGRATASGDLRSSRDAGSAERSEGGPGGAPVDGGSLDDAGTDNLPGRPERDTPSDRGGSRGGWVGRARARLSQAFADGLGRWQDRRGSGGSGQLHADGGGDGPQGRDRWETRRTPLVAPRAEHRGNLDLRAPADQHDRDVRSGRAGGLRLSETQGGGTFCAGSPTTEARERTASLGTGRITP